MKKILLLLILLLIPFVSAQSLLIESVSSNPASIEPGEQADVSIVLKNIGDKDIEDIEVNVNLANLPFAPVNSVTEQVIDKINDGDNERVEFNLVALPDATPGIYKIPLSVKYGNIVKESIFSLNVESKVSLDVSVGDSKVYSVGDTGNVDIEIVNKGLGEIKFLTVKLVQSNAYDILSNEQVYIGTIASDDFDSAQFNIHLNEKITSLPVIVEYRDINNKLNSKVINLNFNTYTKEEAKKLGLVKTSKAPQIIITIVVLIILYWIYRKVKKRKR